MVFAIDFDGTCVRHKYPEIGEDVPGAVDVLLRLQEAGHQLILYTMRSKRSLMEAVEWFKDRNIELYDFNRNPTQDTWTTSPKVYAQIYIDDAALGCPLKRDSPGERAYVDWDIVEKVLVANKKIEPKSKIITT
jgi:hypothetical protein